MEGQMLLLIKGKTLILYIYRSENISGTTGAL